MKWLWLSPFRWISNCLLARPRHLAMQRRRSVIATLLLWCHRWPCLSGLGYEAIPCVNDTAQSIPFALDAGLGELSRLNKLVTPEFGPAVRLCKVFTDMPMAYDKPIDFGLVEFCKGCKKCAEACPSRALSFDDEPSSKPKARGIIQDTKPVRGLLQMLSILAEVGFGVRRVSCQLPIHEGRSGMDSRRCEGHNLHGASHGWRFPHHGQRLGIRQATRA